MHDNTWLLPVLIIGPMVIGMMTLFIFLAIYSRKSAQRGETPGVVSYQPSPSRSSPNNSAMSKSGAALIPAGSGKTRFSDVAGCDEAKAELQEIVEYLLEPGIFDKYGAKIPKGVLLVGPPGTGKTLLAKAVAGESKASFLSISGPSFVEMFVGIGAARVRDLFEQAKKNAPCIIFVDEIDAVGRRRSNAPNSNDERESTLNQLLVELDGFAEITGVVVIAATNRLDILDPALIRPGRFDRHINVELPDVVGRRAIFAVHTRNKPVAQGVDIEQLARLTPGLSGADIEAVCNEAATQAARREIATQQVQAGTPNEEFVTHQDFDEGLLRVQMGVALGSRKRALSLEQLLNAAIHEVGHAWVAESVEGGFPVNRISVLPRGRSLGHTSAMPEGDQTSMTDAQIKARISIYLAGRIAQKEILGIVDSGASDDFANVAKLARQYVVDFGMSTFGPAAALGMQNYEGVALTGQKFTDKIDDECKELIESCIQTAVELIRRNQEGIKFVAGELVKRETLLRDEWLNLMMKTLPKDAV